jgi:sugar O-acyltransferase (sialic acid O-acetyltransferase NeuD family)
MLQILGKGGAAREVACCYTGQISFFENDEIKNASETLSTIIAIGDGYVRKKIAEKYPRLQYSIFNHGKVVARHTVEIGAGTIICAEAIITCNAKIGKHCLININANVHHDCVLGDYVTISPSATVCGHVTIGDLCYIGANAVIREKITICPGVTIGCGAVVVKDITEPGIYVGNPVRKIK